MDFPPTATDSFRTKGGGESTAEGFRMQFEAPGSLYRIRIEPPRQVAPGAQFVNFYASFYSAVHTESIVEAGISFSQRKGWNYFANFGGGVAPEHRLHHDLTKAAALELLVHFVPDGDGKSGRVFSKLDGGLGLEHRVTPLRPVNIMRLVMATGGHADSSFSKTTMTLLGVDGKPPSQAGKVEFMAGGKVTADNRQMRPLPGSAFSLSGLLLDPNKQIHHKLP